REMKLQLLAADRVTKILFEGEQLPGLARTPGEVRRAGIRVAWLRKRDQRAIDEGRRFRAIARIDGGPCLDFRNQLELANHNLVTERVADRLQLARCGLRVSRVAEPDGKAVPVDMREGPVLADCGRKALRENLEGLLS